MELYILLGCTLVIVLGVIVSNIFMVRECIRSGKEATRLAAELQKLQKHLEADENVTED